MVQTPHSELHSIITSNVQILFQKDKTFNLDDLSMVTCQDLPFIKTLIVSSHLMWKFSFSGGLVTAESLTMI
jgi:hypothetical protein